LIVLDEIRRQHPEEVSCVFPEAQIAFSAMGSLVPCDLLEEMLHGIVVLHDEAAKVFGTTQISVDAFFPILTYVMVHAEIPFIHAYLYLMEQYALADTSSSRRFHAPVAVSQDRSSPDHPYPTPPPPRSSEPNKTHMNYSHGNPNPNRNGEESYYVYCLHAAVEYICSYSTT
jgi:hypothetical protein